MERMFGSDYREAVKVHQAHRPWQRKLPRRQMSAALRTVAEYGQKRAQFDNHAAYREMLGVHFQGVLSPWDDLDAVLLWYEQVFVALARPSGPFGAVPPSRVYGEGRTSEGNQSQSHADGRTSRSRFSRSCRGLPSSRTPCPVSAPSWSRDHLTDILACLQKLTREVGDALQSIERAAIGDDVVLRDVKNIMAAAGQCRNAISAVQGAADLPSAHRGRIPRGQYRHRTHQIHGPVCRIHRLRQPAAKDGRVASVPGLWNPPRGSAHVARRCPGLRGKASRHLGRTGDAVGSRVLERQCRQSLGQPAGARRIRANEPRRAGYVESFSARPNPEPGKRPRQTHGAWRRRAP